MYTLDDEATRITRNTKNTHECSDTWADTDDVKTGDSVEDIQPVSGLDGYSGQNQVFRLQLVKLKRRSDINIE